MFRDCGALAEASGAVEILERHSTYDRSNAAQVAGRCRMGSSPENSVTDSRGRVPGVENLYIRDASVMAGQGAGDAPSLTFQALAWPTADAITGRTRFG